VSFAVRAGAIVMTGTLTACAVSITGRVDANGTGDCVRSGTFLTDDGVSGFGKR
jgi:hypothetical protein